jgi:hypothetical protein
MDNLSISRDHELYSIARGIVVHCCNGFFEMDVCFGADINALASRFPFISQPGEIS